MMLADLSTSAVQLAGWMASAAFLIGFVNGALKLVDRIKGKAPEPANEQLETGRRELERRVSAVESEVSTLRSNQAHEREQIEVAARARSNKIYEKIDEVRTELSLKVDDLRTEVTKQFKDTERALGRIEGKLNQ